MDWIDTNEPAGIVDFNGNGRIDFADVIRLFHEV
jgi:PKD repeat protein